MVCRFVDCGGMFTVSAGSVNDSVGAARCFRANRLAVTFVRGLILGANVAASVIAAGAFWQWGVMWPLWVAAAAPLLWFAPTLVPNCEWFGPVLQRLPAPAGGSVWLTIDDGPDPGDTLLMLDILDRHRAKATFFVIGTKAREHPELIREIVRRGHGLGNHTMTHPDKWFWAFGPRRIREEIAACQSVLAGIVPQAHVRCFRAPVGHKNGFVHAALKRLGGLMLVGWSVRGFDGVSTNVEAILKRLRRGIGPGAIVLIHEGRVDGRGERLGPQVLQGVLSALAESGLDCVSGETYVRQFVERS